MAYRSYIPPLIADYGIEADSFDVAGLHSRFEALAAALEAADGPAIASIMQREAYTSYDIAADHASNPFAFFALGNENAENIIRAARYGIEALDELPLSTRLIRNLHYIICEGSDYDRKYRGEIRRSPVWIGRQGAGIQDADYVAPVDDDLTGGLTDLENYINYSDDDQFVKSAVIHYQFEMLHPFVDGNGRCGRLLNNLFLFEAGRLPHAALLLSPVIARGYNDYCAHIQHMNDTQDMAHWIQYWLRLLDEAALLTLKSAEPSQIQLVL